MHRVELAADGTRPAVIALAKVGAVGTPLTGRVGRWQVGVDLLGGGVAILSDLPGVRCSLIGADQTRVALVEDDAGV